MFRSELDRVVNYTVAIFEAKVKADANENLLNYPDRLHAILSNAVMETFEKMRYYPEIDSDNLRKALGKFYGFEKDNFVVSNGSDELIKLIIQSTCYPGDFILTVFPCFAMYKISADILSVSHSSFDITESWRLDPEKFVSFAKKIDKLKVVFLDTPNNPLGIAYPYEDVEYIVKNLQETLIVIDNAYGEYCQIDYLPLLKYPNVIVTRTFSKLGFAGLRCGYAVSSKKNIEYLNRVKPPYNVNIFAQVICAKVLENFELLKQNVETIKTERDRMFEKLRQWYFVLPSQANFLSIIDQRSQSLYDIMRRNGILVKLFKLRNFDLLRITVGEPSNNRVVVSLLANFWEGEVHAHSGD